MSQTSDILAFLNDGEWHTVAEIHAVCGYSRLNSRVSELRERGHTVECEHIRGAGTGSAAYRYRLVIPVPLPTFADWGPVEVPSLFPTAPGAYDR